MAWYEKAKCNFKLYDFTYWKTSNYISRSKGNQAIKFNHLIAYKVEILFFENHAENVIGRLVPDLPLFFKKDSCEVKASSQHLDNWTLRNRLGHIIKAKFITFQYDDPAICSILIFIKGLKTRFFKKNVSYLYSTNRINFIVWLPLLHEKLDHNIRIAIASIPVCDVTNFETFVFSSSHFLHNQKNQDKNLNILTGNILTGNKT